MNTNFRKSDLDGAYNNYMPVDNKFMNVQDSYNRNQAQFYPGNNGFTNIQNDQYSTNNTLEPIGADLDPIDCTYTQDYYDSYEEYLEGIKRKRAQSPFYNFRRWGTPKYGKKDQQNTKPKKSAKSDFLTKVIVYRILPAEQEKLLESFVASHPGPLKKSDLRLFARQNNLNYQRILGYLRAKCVEKQKLSVETEIGVLNQVRRLNFENSRVWQEYVKESNGIFKNRAPKT